MLARDPQPPDGSWRGCPLTAPRGEQLAEVHRRCRNVPGTRCFPVSWRLSEVAPASGAARLPGVGRGAWGAPSSLSPVTSPLLCSPRPLANAGGTWGVCVLLLLLPRSTRLDRTSPTRTSCGFTATQVGGLPWALWLLPRSQAVPLISRRQPAPVWPLPHACNPLR